MAKTFDQYMAETGRQSELDQLRRTGQYETAKSNYESGSNQSSSYSVPNYADYYNKANQALEAYYKRLLLEEQGDVERVKRRLEEDYAKGNRITMEDFTRETEYAQGQAGLSIREQEQQNVGEDRANQENLLQRGVSLGGLADKQTGEVKDRQALRREAIDRALKKSEEDLKYGKERKLEETATTKLRGGEDVGAQFQRFQTEKSQEREEKALGLGESMYQRDLQKRQAEETLKANERALKLQEEALRS